MTEEKAKIMVEKASRFLQIKKLNKITPLIPIKDPVIWKA